MTDNKAFYVYILRDPRPGKNLQPIYVGKGRGYRARQHWLYAEEHKNNLLRRILTKLRKAGLEIVTEYAAYFDLEADAFQREIDLIAQYGRRNLGKGPLCNLTDGGEGASGCLAAIEAGRKNMHRLHADPQWAKARDERSSRTMHKCFADAEWKKSHAERTGKGVLQRYENPEWAKAQAERTRQTLQKRNTDPEFIKIIAERTRERFADPEFAEAHAKQMRKRNTDPEFIRTNTELWHVRHGPEFAKAHAERMRARRNDQEFQAKMKAGRDAYWAKRRAAKNQHTGAHNATQTSLPG